MVLHGIHGYIYIYIYIFCYWHPWIYIASKNKSDMYPYPFDSYIAYNVISYYHNNVFVTACEDNKLRMMGNQFYIDP